MNYLTTSPIVIAILAILYIVFSVVITKYILSNGKNEKQIIEDNKLRATKAKSFLNKYPEANFKSVRRLSLAFGFIFAFASSIYAFSIMGKTNALNTFIPPIVDSAFVIQIQAPIRLINKKIAIKDVPPPPPPTATFKIKTKINPEPPEVVDPNPAIPKDKTPFLIPIEIEGKEDKVPLSFAEIMPRFRGCEGIENEDEAYQCTMSNIQKYIASIDYPIDAYNNDIEGKVYVSFVIDKNGSISDVELIRGADSSLDKQSINHVKKMPNFASAGRQGGKNVRVKFQIPIVFKLN